MINIGTPVRCNNCGLNWLRVLPTDNPGGTVRNEDIQFYCPKCGSNWRKTIEGEIIKENE